MCLVIPKEYKNSLSVIETQQAIKDLKDFFENRLGEMLKLTRVSSPLFVLPETGTNDNLNGVETPVSFEVPYLHKDAEIVHSLAKWKRMALKKYGFPIGRGLYTDMNAIRKDEELDNLHSLYVDQWDWELVIAKEDRTMDTLKEVVRDLFEVFKETEEHVHEVYPEAVYLMQIGKTLSDGKKHDGRSPDYDDWDLNGDILFYNSVLDQAIELSSMGIRVDEDALERQLKAAGCEDRKELDYHKALLAGKLPYTIGGGIGQSRICMFFLNKAHIGEVQVGIWPEKMIEECSEAGIELL